MKYNDALSKAESIVNKMTVEEVASQLLYNSPAIERLGIHEYNWWNEALHGVARAGTATVFPQAIGIAASFNIDLISSIADTIAEEARAKYNQSVEFNDRDIFKGLTFWSPNINIFRDPRWGRGQETFGEDPYLTAEMGCSFIKALQGDGEFLKAAACAKHFAAHSGPEGKRHSFNAVVSKKDLFETYLLAFEWAVKKAGVRGVMGAYSRTNGEPCCASKTLIKDILLDQWNFKGYFVSDCGAIADICTNHHYTSSHTESAALSLKMGCDLNCGEIYTQLIDAYEEDLVTEKELREAATRLYAIRVLLGEFEVIRPYADVPFNCIENKKHKELNLEAARESLVLLKNEQNFLPLDKNKKIKIAAVGPNVMSIRALEGNYYGRASEYITVADGIKKVFANSEIFVAEGSQLAFEKENDWDGFGKLHSTGASAARASDVTVLCLGLDRTLEGEEGCTDAVEGFISGDRTSIFLPKTQQKLAEMVCDNCENVVIVVMSGSPIDLGEQIRSRAKAIIQAWYPGAAGGLAIAQLISGEFSPSGRLPITFPHGDDKLPDFEDYSMNGRTYRYLDCLPVYPFGFGLSYTSFDFSDPRIEHVNDDSFSVTVTVTNTGDVSSICPLQIYAKYTDTRCATPHYQMCGIKSVLVDSHESKTVSISVDKSWIMAVNDEGERIIPNGETTLYIGNHQPDVISNQLSEDKCISISLKNEV